VRHGLLDYRCAADEPPRRAREAHGMAHTRDAAKAGIGFGSALAITISWSVNKSILWAIIHGACSWFYVVYYAFTH
jgi:hypothetical protein